ncbi:hypothetical protein EOD42_13915 [Rhodovarius crocodyli]|uniref:Uncharacterized protein n=1 Tax=Rhodovarius crocodyli TaxID=1979269 RepID=A0A437MEY0_9PROT|nr:hypothetical protein [Rhodovarius crocodyli]RVT96208.1 hypothetical protein EOD42_13915 [Rhodovarius crocodyli]
MPDGSFDARRQQMLQDMHHAVPGVTLHARERMLERHGRDLTRLEWLHAVMSILDRRALLLSSKIQSNGWAECWAVTVGAVTIRMMWSPDRAHVLTVLDDEHSQGGRAVNMALASPLKITAPPRKPTHWSRR